MTCPGMKETLEIYEQTLRERCNNSSRFACGRAKGCRIHNAMVALCAEMIASKLPDIDGQKAYILGLLHDFGKLVYDDEFSDKFHGIEGCRFFLEKGWDEPARICLTHSFPDKNIKYSEYPGYSARELRKCKMLLAKIDYDDYDRLIQLCDMLVVGINFTNVKERINFIRNNYKLPLIALKKKYRQALKLKRYFDEKCGCDIYKLLGVA